MGGLNIYIQYIKSPNSVLCMYVYITTAVNILLGIYDM